MLESGMLSFHPAASRLLRCSSGAIALCSCGAIALCALLSGCGAADPAVIGEYETGSDSVPGAGDPGAHDSEGLGSEGGGFISNAASCQSTPFEACGGSIAGTWKVVETCNSESRNEASLAQWSEWVGLPQEACTGAARRLTSSWTGELTFSGRVAYDQRDLDVILDMDLTSRCLTAALNSSAGMVTPTAGACAALTSGFDVTCGSRDGMCACSTKATVSTE